MSHLKQCLGVDLGHHAVKIVELALDKGGVRVVKAASAPTGVSPNMSDDERRQAIATAARDVLKKNKFGTRKAVFAISGLKVFVRRFRLPKTTEERLERMIQFEARQQIPFPVEKTTLQFQHRELAGEGDVEVLLSAVRTDEIRDYMQIVNKSGLNAIAVGVSSFALYNSNRLMSLTREEAGDVFAALAGKAPKKAKDKKPKKAKAKKPKKGEEPAPESAEDEALSEQKTIDVDANDIPADEFAYEEVKGLVNIGASSYDIAIGRMGKSNASILFIRTVAMGGDNMTKAVQKALGVESFFDAERIKTSSTQLMAFNFDFENEGEINQEASMAVTEVADRMVTEIRRSLDFFITQPDGMAIDALVLSGGQAMIPQMDSYLEEKLTVPVSVMREIPAESAIRWPESAGQPTPYMVAMGLALQGIGLGDIAVDFLPEERKIVRDFPYKVTVIMGILLIALIVIASMMGNQYAMKYESQAGWLQGEMTKRQDQSREFDQAQELHNKVAEDYVVLSKTLGQRDLWLDFLARLAEIKPAGVLLEDVVLEHDGRVKITGLSEVQVSAAYFRDAINDEFGGVAAADAKPEDKVTELKEPPKIDSVAPAGRAIEGLGNDPSRFTISFTLKTKVNHLKITPTPTPTPVGAPAGGNFPGAGGNFYF